MRGCSPLSFLVYSYKKQTATHKIAHSMSARATAPSMSPVPGLKNSTLSSLAGFVPPSKVMKKLSDFWFEVTYHASNFAPYRGQCWCFHLMRQSFLRVMTSRCGSSAGHFEACISSVLDNFLYMLVLGSMIPLQYSTALNLHTTSKGVHQQHIPLPKSYMLVLGSLIPLQYPTALLNLHTTS